MDPMADKLMVNTALLMLVYLGLVNVILAILLIGREVVVNALRTLASQEGIMITPSLSARIKVFAEGFGIGFLLLGPENRLFNIPWMQVGNICLYGAVVLALWSAIAYFRDYYRHG